VLIKQAKKISA